MFPKASQIFLAVSTLLFFLSVECLLLTLVHIKPGRIAQQFSPTQCNVISTFYHGNTTCHVDSMSHHGEPRIIPCLQIYVKPAVNENHAPTKTEQNILPSDIAWTPQSDSETTLPSFTSATSKEQKTAIDNNSDNENVLLMFEDERNYAGLDYLYRRCSYLPDFCDNDLTVMLSDIYVFACKNGKVNTTLDCYYDSQENRVILNKYISSQVIVYFVIGSVGGILLSTLCCIGFWKRNHKRASRLFVYNSWSAS